MKKVDLEKIISVLRGTDINESCITELSFILDNAKSENINLMDRNFYFAISAWQENDIVMALEKNGVAVTPENISLVMRKSKRGLEDSSEYWEMLDDIIRPLKIKGELK